MYKIPFFMNAATVYDIGLLKNDTDFSRSLPKAGCPALIVEIHDSYVIYLDKTQITSTLAGSSDLFSRSMTYTGARKLFAATTTYFPVTFLIATRD